MPRRSGKPPTARKEGRHHRLCRADGRGDDRSGDQTLGFGVVDAFSVVKSMNTSHFDSTSAEAWNLGNQTCEFKKANIGTITANQVFFSPSFGRVDVNVLVCDSVFDGQERYDTAFFDFDKDLGNGFTARMRQGDWAPFALPQLTAPADPTFPELARGVVGSWVKLLAFAPDLSAFNIYLGNVVHNVGYP